MNYYLEDHPNAAVPQYGWPRTRVSGVVGVHTTESGVYLEGADPGAENTAGYLSRRTNHGSYHIMADWDTIIPLVRPTFAAWADTTNNAHALSVSGAMNAARWRDLSPERAAGIVRNMGIAAAVLVRDAIAHGVLDEIVPARRITAQQAIDGSAKGFYGHGETNPGTRYDPGTNFDWDLFLASYAAAVGGNITYQSTSQEDDMANVPQHEWEAVAQAAARINGVITDPHAKVLTTNDIGAIADAVLDEGVGDHATGNTTSLRRKIQWLKHEQNLAGNQLAALNAKVDALTELAASGSALSKEEATAVLREAVKESFGRYELTKVEEDVA